MEIAIDFDGTVVTHDYPKVGVSVKAESVLLELTKQKHNLILFTMRSGKELQDAINWFKNNNIPLYGIQYNPTQKDWTQSNKCYAQMYIDDAALGCPLIAGKHSRPFVNWRKVKNQLVKQGILKKPAIKQAIK